MRLPAWLASIAARLRAALADGAIRVADEAGHLVLVRSDGWYFTAPPGTVAQLAAAGLLLPLPPAVPVEPEPDPTEQAEREAVRSMPPLPPEGSPERSRLDAKQAETVRGLLEASRVRPSCFEGTATSPPPLGSFCSTCRSRCWWYPRRPAKDGTGPSAHWRCSVCRPAPLPLAERVEVAT